MSAFKKFQRFLVVFLLGVGCFFGGMYFGKRGYELEVKKNPPEVTIIHDEPIATEVDFARFWEVWDLVSEMYLDRPVDPQKMLWGATMGMVEALGDPYTSFLPPAVNEAVTSSINGEYQGIGAELSIKEGWLVVVAPLDGSPAKAAGVKAGDRIVEIEGESTIGMALTEAVSKIRGDAGTTSTLKLQRNSDEPFVVHIQRGVINIASVTWEDKGEGTAYIRVSRFGEDTNGDWSRIAKEVSVQMSELDAVVLDVRGNPGGYMDSAVYIAAEFVKGKQVMMYTESALGELTPFENGRLGSFETLPRVVILIDEGSASASEILAAAIEFYHDDVTLVGQKSFGKGTIQEAKDFSDGSGVHITIAKWLTPGKVWVHEKGIEPDVVVENVREDLEEGVDAQLDKALELASEI